MKEKTEANDLRLLFQNDMFLIISSMLYASPDAVADPSQTFRSSSFRTQTGIIQLSNKDSIRQGFSRVDDNLEAVQQVRL
jgi:hypothetical protein